MPKDHYIAQTYLKEFLDPDSGMLHVWQKQPEVKYHPSRTKDICYEMEGSSNPYSAQDRVVEEYLKTVEPHWTKCVENLKNKQFDDETKYLMAGYIAFLRSYNPTARRFGKKGLEFIMEASKPYFAKGMIKDPPKGIEDPEEMVKLFLSDAIKVEVDGKFPLAINVSNLYKTQQLLYSSPWMITYNKTDNPFITCDYPATYWYFKNQIYYAHYFIPITPEIAVIIMPIPKEEREKMKEIPPDVCGETEKRRVKMFNRLVVQSAEKFVIASARHTWIKEIVSKYRNWRMEQENTKMPIPGEGTLLLSNLRAREVT